MKKLQDLTKLFVAKSRYIRAGVRDGIVEKFVVPIIIKIEKGETTLIANISDLKALHIDDDIKIYQAKVHLITSLHSSSAGSVGASDIQLNDAQGRRNNSVERDVTERVVTGTDVSFGICDRLEEDTSVVDVVERGEFILTSLGFVWSTTICKLFNCG
ncbi:hypothetical protein AVEN_180720-1 [Araneus ventricosus]|uniref:Uncharacterized protein n=1 Tax=Araneus ventricosus TaxID=182803 RepID=A0A4Y2FWE7_ARAVE|nr:hypothetical protein AVEN_180720-1 [Araneus ventricosus]